MQEQAPKNEQAPSPTTTNQPGTTDPTATAIAKRLQEVQDQILDVTNKLSDVELAKLRTIKEAGKKRLAELAAEGKVPGAGIKAAPLKLVINEPASQQNVEALGVIPEDVAREAFDGLPDLDRLDKRQAAYDKQIGGKAA